MNMLFIKPFVVGFMVSKIQRVSVFGYFPLPIIYLILRVSITFYYNQNHDYLIPCIHSQLFNIIHLDNFFIEKGIYYFYKLKLIADNKCNFNEKTNYY